MKAEAVPLNDDQLRAIGRITVTFTELELELNILVWGLISPNINIGRLILEGENFDRMLTKAKRLSQEVFREDPELGTRIREWAKGADNVKRRRNDILHANWALDQLTGDMVGLRILGRGIPEVSASADQLNGLADDILRSRQELMRIINDIPNFPPQPWFPQPSS